MVGRPTRMLRFRSLTFPPSLLMPATAARAPFPLPNEVKSGPTGSDPEVDGANFGRLLHLSPKENTYNSRSRTCASLDFNKMAFKCEQRSGTRISAKYQWSHSSIRSFLQILGLMARPTTWQPIQGLLLARDPSLWCSNVTRRRRKVRSAGRRAEYVGEDEEEQRESRKCRNITRQNHPRRRSGVERRFIWGRCQSMDDEEDDLESLPTVARREGGWRSHRAQVLDESLHCLS